jgi:hypothetical protein
MIELVVSSVFLVLVMTLQDTYFAHVFIAIASNTAGLVIKLVSAPVILCMPSTNGKDHVVRTWQAKFYAIARFIALLVLFWGCLTNWLITTYVIAKDSLYSDPVWGLCQ